MITPEYNTHDDSGIPRVIFFIKNDITYIKDIKRLRSRLNVLTHVNNRNNNKQ